MIKAMDYWQKQKLEAVFIAIYPGGLMTAQQSNLPKYLRAVDLTLYARPQAGMTGEPLTMPLSTLNVCLQT